MRKQKLSSARGKHQQMKDAKNRSFCGLFVLIYESRAVEVTQACFSLAQGKRQTLAKQGASVQKLEPSLGECIVYSLAT